MKGIERMVRWVRQGVTRVVLAKPLVLGVVALVLLSQVGGEGVRANQGVSQAVPGSSLRSSVTAGPAASDEVAYLNCRFGAGQSVNPVTAYNLAPLNLGWYANWRAEATPSRPGGMEYVQVIRVSDGARYGEREHPGPVTYSPSGEALRTIVEANPGSLWLVGNEPDCIWQDNVLPENYAVAYHEAYEAIKAADPTAKVSVGGIVQPTPLRLEYLDAVLDAYVSRYDRPLPTDAWNIHTYILNEERNGWGAEIPPGSAADEGEVYELGETDDLGIFRERIVDFRRWMYGRGYRNAPLLITEYGTLLPYYGLDPEWYYRDSEGNPFDEDRARDFMYSTFDFLLTEDDIGLGYPADENRLVQRWIWYSLDDVDYGGPLFDPYTYDATALGVSLADYTRAIAPGVDLVAVEVGQVGPAPLSPTEVVTVTLRARISNAGNVALTEPVTVRFLDEEGRRIGDDVVVTEALAGCATTRSVTVTWQNVAPGAHVVRAVVDPEGAVSETDATNNEAEGVILVAEAQLFLPLVSRRR